MRRIVAAAAIAGFSLVAAACGGADEDVVVSAADGASESANVIDASVLTGTATAINGETFDLGTLVDKDLVVWFWAPW